MEEKKKSRKRLLIEIDEEVHKQIKIRAALRNASIKEWVTMAIALQMKWEEHYEN